eukprot:gnl/Chilomastix_cuspidata/776.p1 GENE.gnl/Chilomastix_cuspidata/776~~gnl/Chilomastix_cuspidata/776.p1  ORF type:complete len:616 (-),score=132.17 gnl/Chilomastix_cuspidata/776:55-1842(-)
MESRSLCENVIYISRIPSGLTLAKVKEFCSFFGEVISCIFSGRHKHCFMEFSHKEEAKKAIHIINTLSSHRFESNDCSRFIAANPFIRSLKAQTSNHSISLAITNSGVLLVNFTNVMRDVTAAAVYDIFRPFGEILKIIVFEKGGNLCDKALVQFRQLADAARAYEEMNNAFVWENTLVFVQFSRRSDIKIKPWQSRDKFIDVTAGASRKAQGLIRSKSEKSFPSFTFSQPKDNLNSHLSSSVVPFDCDSPRPDRESPFAQFRLFGPDRPSSLHTSPRPCLPKPARPKDDPYNPFMTQRRSQGNLLGAAERFTPSPSPGAQPQGCVLLVSNLVPYVTKAIHLFNLFSQYGQVVTVKILPKKPDRALVQLINSEHARSCQQNLNALPFEGQILSVVPSHFSIVTGNPDQQTHLTFDSRLQSFSPDHAPAAPSNQLLILLKRNFCTDVPQAQLRQEDAFRIVIDLFRTTSSNLLTFGRVFPQTDSPRQRNRAARLASGLSHAASSPNLLQHSVESPPVELAPDVPFKKDGGERSPFIFRSSPTPFTDVGAPAALRARDSAGAICYKLTFASVQDAAAALAKYHETQCSGVFLRCHFF